MELRPPPRSIVTPARAVSLRVVIGSILGFWIVYFALTTLRALLMGYAAQRELLLPRALVSLVGIGIVFLFYLALRPLDRATFRTRILAAVALSVPAAALYALVNYAVFYHFMPVETALSEGPPPPGEAMMMIVDATITWYFMFAAWAALYLALGYSSDVHAAERRATASAAEANIARLRALRYQINPHFLFNTLNSLSALVLHARTAEAERMIMNLATFLRTSLTAEPIEDVTLADEIRLQRLYLDIECVRFPDRLLVAFDVPIALADACVPALLLQPLVENAIKHGVSRTLRPVTVAITAAVECDHLRLCIADDADPAADAPPAPTSGIGIANVAARLAARFGTEGSVEHGPRRDGPGWIVTLRLPLVRHGR